jgi:hypothetical protein
MFVVWLHELDASVSWCAPYEAAWAPGARYQLIYWHNQNNSGPFVYFLESWGSACTLLSLHTYLLCSSRLYAWIFALVPQEPSPRTVAVFSNSPVYSELYLYTV